MPAKPGYYTVKARRHAVRIGLETGQNWKDISRWNQLENADLIGVGQVLRVVPPSQDPGQVASRTGGDAAHRAASDRAAKPRWRRRRCPRRRRPPRPPAASATDPAIDQHRCRRLRPGPTALNRPRCGRRCQLAVAVPVRSSPASRAPAVGHGDLRQEGDPVLAAAGSQVVGSGSGLRGYSNRSSSSTTTRC